MPSAGAIDLAGLDIGSASMAELLSVDIGLWREEAALSARDFKALGDLLPPALWREHAALVDRLERVDAA